MPELPEVETVRKGLEDRLRLFCIERIEVCRARAIASPGGPNKFIEGMTGLFVGEWTRRGKYLLASLHNNFPEKSGFYKLTDSAGWWCIHLRMTGNFQWYENHISPCSHTRVRFWNKEGAELRFVDMRSFGQMWWIPPESSPEEVIKGLRNLGPEPFNQEFNPTYLFKRLKGKKNSIKTALLDQSVVAGVGNIYADESLFEAGIVPQKISGCLSENELQKLCKCLPKVLKESIGKGGTTFKDFRDIEGLNGNYGEQAWVYKRENKPCRKCGAKIKRQKICGRSSHWCPTCQT